MNQLNLIRKIREYRPDPHLPISADDIKKYRERLLQHDHLTDAEEEEMRITANWLYQLDLPYKVPESPDLKKTVRLCCGFTDEIFLSILPDLCNLWTYSTHMVALYHTMIYDGWMCPVVFRYWVGWFNEHVEEIGLPDKKMSDDMIKKINKHLATPERIQWDYETYLKYEESESTKTRNVFNYLCELCDAIRQKLDEMDSPDIVRGTAHLI